MNPSLLLSLNKRVKTLQATPDWFASSFPEQIAFIQDKSRLKAARCTRRAGKSYGVGLQLFKDAWENPGCNVLYMALSADSAKRIMWKDIFQVINRTLKIGAEFKETTQTIHFPNGSVLYTLGADAKPDEMNKVLGAKYKFVVVDEASKYHIDVKRLVYDVLKSTTIDSLGQIAMIGTTDNFVKSFFAEVTLGKELGWSLHRWAAKDNPHVKTQVLQEMAELLAANPNVANEPWYRQNYLAEWDVDTRLLVYKHKPENIIRNLPPLKDPVFTLVATVSAAKNICGYALLAYGKDSRDAFIVEARRGHSADPFTIVEEISNFDRDYPLSEILTVDPSDRLADELRKRMSISIQNINEKDKLPWIQLFNADLEKNNIKVLDQNADILDEWRTIIRDESRTGQFREHPLCLTQVATAALYAWTRCYNYMYEEAHESSDPMDQFWSARHEELKNSDQDF